MTSSTNQYTKTMNANDLLPEHSHKQTQQKNAVILPNFPEWKFCGKAQFAFPQNFRTMKSGEITVFLAVRY